MRPTPSQVAAAKDFRTAMKQWISSDSLPVTSNSRRYATVGQWKEFYRRSETDVIDACQWLNEDVLAVQGKPAAPETNKPETNKPETNKPETNKPETKGIETMSNLENTNLTAVAGQIAAALAALQAGAGVNAAEVEKIVDARLAASPVIKHEFYVNDQLIAKTSLGDHPMIGTVINWLSVDCPVYLYGPAGTGKSSLARAAGKALNLQVFQYGALLSKYDVLGSMSLSNEYQRSAFREWYEHGGLLVLDEIDGSDPRAIVAINDALRSREGTPFNFPDGQVLKHKDCRLVVTANTVGRGASPEYIGRFKLDAASLNGFVQVFIDYDPKVEKSLSAGCTEWLELCRNVRKAAEDLKIPLIVSYRQIDFGARLISRSANKDQAATDAMNHVLRGGLAADQWSLIAKKIGMAA